MKTRYSNFTRCFYPFDIDYGESLPNDVIEVSQDDFNTAMCRPVGCGFNFDSGMLAITEPPVTPLSDILSGALVELRAERAPIIATLDGIAGRTYRAGDTITSNAADVAINSLLDITALPALLNAKSYDEMRKVIFDEYKKIKDNGPPSIATAFPS